MDVSAVPERENGVVVVLFFENPGPIDRIDSLDKILVVFQRQRALEIQQGDAAAAHGVPVRDLELVFLGLVPLAPGDLDLGLDDLGNLSLLLLILSVLLSHPGVDARIRDGIGVGIRSSLKENNGNVGNRK